MSGQTAREVSPERQLPRAAEDRIVVLESRIRQKMRLYPLVRAVRSFGVLARTAQALGHHAGLASRFLGQLFARKKPQSLG